MIYVEEEADGWHADCGECRWQSGPHASEADAHQAADAHDLEMGEVTPNQRP